MTTDEYQTINDKLDAMRSQLAETNSSIKLLSHRANGHHRTLYGNGRPGLVERLDKMESSQESTSRLMRWQVGIGVSILALLVSAGVGIAAIIF